MKATRKVAAGLALVLASAGVYQVGGWILDEGSGVEHLKGRAWVNQLPRTPKDRVHVLFLDTESPFGVTIHGSNYRHLTNAVQFRLEGDVLELISLQDEVKAQVKVRTWECEEAPEGLDLCLEIAARGRKVRLFSARAWGDEGESGVVALARGAVPDASTAQVGGAAEVAGPDEIEAVLGF